MMNGWLGLSDAFAMTYNYQLKLPFLMMPLHKRDDHHRSQQS
jgi:hypothetical protein